MKDSFWIATNRKHEVPAPPDPTPFPLPEPEPTPIPGPPAQPPTPEPLPGPVSGSLPIVGSAPPVYASGYVGKYQALAPFEEVEAVEEPPFPGMLGYNFSSREEQRQLDEAQIVPIKKRRKKKGWKVWWPKSYRMLYKGIRL